MESLCSMWLPNEEEEEEEEEEEQMDKDDPDGLHNLMVARRAAAPSVMQEDPSVGCG